MPKTVIVKQNGLNQNGKIYLISFDDKKKILYWLNLRNGCRTIPKTFEKTKKKKKNAVHKNFDKFDPR